MYRQFTVAQWRAAERQNFKWDCGQMNEKLTRKTTANTIGLPARTLHPSLLRCYAVSDAKQLPTFRRRMLCSTSGVISRKRVVAQAQVEILRSFETAVAICQSIWRHVEESSNLKIQNAGRPANVELLIGNWPKWRAVTQTLGRICAN
jgi:hypothetical protein